MKGAPRHAFHPCDVWCVSCIMGFFESPCLQQSSPAHKKIRSVPPNGLSKTAGLGPFKWMTMSGQTWSQKDHCCRKQILKFDNTRDHHLFSQDCGWPGGFLTENLAMLGRTLEGRIAGAALLVGALQWACCCGLLILAICSAV